MTKTSSTQNIGVPLDTVSCFVIEPIPDNALDGSFTILPKGEVGELAVGGYQLASEYLNNPQKTNAAFMDTPYGRLYRTGDKARVTSEGTLECLGRLAEGQVKLRGQRIELGEVEQALLACTGCYGAVALVIENIMVAFCAANESVTEEEMLNICQRWLPQFMVPGEFHFMDDLPKLPSGKADKTALRNIYTHKHRPRDTSDHLATGDIENILSQIVGRNVTIDSTLATAGIDSLTAIAAASALREAGYETSGSAILAMRTVRDLKTRVKRRQPPEKKSLDATFSSPWLPRALRDLRLKENAIDAVLPCTQLQSGMLAETASNPKRYWNMVDLNISGGESVEKVAKALQQICLVNEMLRAKFIEESGDFYAIICKSTEHIPITISEKDDQPTISNTHTSKPVGFHICADASGQANNVIISIHHACYDGWSMDLLIENLGAVLRGEELQQKPSFRGVVSFLQENRVERNGDDAAFWAQQLEGWSKPTIPTLQEARDGTEETLSQQQPIHLSVSDVGEMCQILQISPQVVFQAALSVVWAGLLGMDDVLFGNVTSGRTIPVDCIQDVFGPCIASLPLRVNMAKMNTNTDLLRSIQSTNNEALHHSGLSLPQIRKIVMENDTQPLYDVLFVYQESFRTRSNRSHFIQERCHLDNLETGLVIEVEPRESHYQLQVTYHADKYSPETIDLISSQIAQAALHIAKDVHQTMQSTRAAISAPLSVYNLKPTTTIRDQNLATLFEESAHKFPHRNALEFFECIGADRTRSRTITYQELNGTSNQIAHLMISRGVRKGAVVPVIMEKSIALYASILAIAKSGCAYLPLLPNTPTERIDTILRQVQPSFCVLQSGSNLETELSTAISPICISLDSLLGLPTSDPEIPVDDSHLSYVIYTSGTTGTPKGVAVTQRNIANNIVYLGQTYPIESQTQSRFLQACSQAFDVSVFEIFFAWHKGMCLCSGTHETLFNDLEHATRATKATHLSLTPTVAAIIDPAEVPDVQFLVTAGEAMTQNVLDKWGTKLWQGYGPSETTNICTVKRMHHSQRIEHLGLVFPNTSVVVLRPGLLETVPVGWVGEFCFGGEQVAAGYLGMPQLTAEKFINHPEYGHLYRSGDIGRMLPDGSLIILGRLDTQIKLRGQRIEPAEINTAVTSHEMVEAAETMLVRTGDFGQEQLATFYAIVSGKEDFQIMRADRNLTQQLFSSLSSRVSSYMVPSYLVPISNVPRTSSGKVDRRRIQAAFNSLLPEDLKSLTSSSDELNSSNDWTDMERLLASSLEQVLKLPPSTIRRWTPFVMLGIDSISAIGISKRLKQLATVEITTFSLLQNPTIAQLGRHVSSQDSRTSSNLNKKWFEDDESATFRERAHSAGRKVLEILPCSPLQEGMLAQGRERYYNRILLRLHVDVGGMKAAWDSAIKRHEILRTAFVTTTRREHPIAQIVLEHSDSPWKEFNVTTLSLDGVVDEHQKTLPEPLDSYQVPLSLAHIRYRGSHFLSFICHHALYDGVAMDCLWREIENLVKHIQLPVATPYAPFLKNALELPIDMESFWLDQFSSFSPSTLFPTKHRRDMTQSTYSVSLESQLADIQIQSRTFGVSMLSLAQATWSQVLSLSMDHADVCFGNVMSGRTMSMDGIENLIAPCFNTIPLRIDLSAVKQNIDVVTHLQKLNGRLLTYQFSPLRFIQKLVGGPKRSLFDTLLLVQQPLKEMDESVWTLEADSGAMDVPLVCEVVPCPNLNSVVVTMHYDMTMVTNTVAAAMTDLFKHIFEQVLRSPHAPPTTKQDIPLPLAQALGELRPSRESLSSLPMDDDSSEVRLSHEESQVQHILAKLSGVSVQSIRKGTSIFYLGLDSINAVQIASMLRDKAYDISASDIVEARTCEKIAQRMKHSTHHFYDPKSQIMYNFSAFSHQVAERVSTALPTGVKTTGIFPSTPLQCAMLASFEQSASYNYLNHISFTIHDESTFKRLPFAWHELISARVLLRVGFVRIEHAHAAYAMVQTTHLSQRVKIDEDMKANTVRNWKAEQARAIREQLFIPPWRVLLAKTGDSYQMHLLIHHALYDAQSFQSLLDDLARLTQGSPLEAEAGIHDSLSALLDPVVYDKEESKAFWDSQSSGLVVNTFPIMTPLRQDERVILVGKRKSNMTFAMLEDLAAGVDVTIQAAIQAAWTRVLAGYLGESRVAYGVTLSTRTAENMNSPLPCLVTVPIIAENVEKNYELLQNMMKFNSAILEHGRLPLGRIQRWLGHHASPVFDTLLVYQKHSDLTSRQHPWSTLADDAIPEYPVSLEIEPEDNQIILRVTYFNDILPEEQATLLLKQFDAALQYILQYPNENSNSMSDMYSDLYSITPARVQAITSPALLLHEFVQISASDSPSKTALEFVGTLDDSSITRTWSFLELEEQGNKVAHLLVPHVSAGDIVGIHFDKCPEAYFSILGILKSGCSFVALDPNAPPARKEFILQDSKAPCVLTNHSAALDFTAPTKVITVDEEDLQQYSSDKIVTPDGLTPDSTCYCLYTSGTTGTPKGCEITHENVVQAMMAFQDLFKGHWDHDSKWLQFASLHFDVSVLEQYWSWSVGMTVVAAKKDLILSDLTGFINKLNITHIDLTPSLARLTHPDDVPSLCKGVFITGGEQLKQEILDSWGSKAVIYNAYGPTEATIGVTMYQRVPQNGRPSNIGQQFLNVGSFVFQQGTDIPVLRGGVGELCVEGKLVGKGYLNRPDLTLEKFPYLEKFRTRVYRTGDLVRILYDGCFDFLGRADDQVKLRGQRLEIGEINHCIRAGVPSVKDVSTLVLKHMKSGKDILVSFITTETTGEAVLRLLEDTTGILAEAKLACQQALPVYMVPFYFLKLSLMPLSSNNKLEAKELKKFFSELSQEDLVRMAGQEASTRADSSQYESKLLSILADVTQIDQTGLSGTTNIFDLGIDSITVINLSSRLRQNGFHGASPAVILRHPILHDLSVALSRDIEQVQDDLTRKAAQLVQLCQHQAMGAVCKTLKIKPGDIEYICPCSPLQQGMVSRSMIEETNPPYFNIFTLSLDSSVSISKIKDAWDSLVASHSILRTTFVNTANGHVQVSRKLNKALWEEVTLSSNDSLTNLTADRRICWINENAAHITAPLRLLMVHHEDGTHCLVVFIFHGLYDGIGFDNLIDDLGSIYKNDEVSQGPGVVEAMVHGPLWDHSSNLKSWKQYLAHWTHSPLPTTDHLDFPSSTATTTLKLPQLDELCAKYRITLQSAILASWTSVLTKLVPSSDFFTTGVVVSGRTINLTNVEKFLGPLFNTLPFFVTKDDICSSQSLCNAAHRFNLLTLDDPHVPLKALQKLCSNGQSMFDNLFAFQVEPDKLEDDGLPWIVDDIPSEPDYLLAFEVTKLQNGCMKLHLVARGDFAKLSELEVLLGEFQQSVSVLLDGWETMAPHHVSKDNNTPERQIERVGDSSSEPFAWNQISTILRQNLATLSKVPEESINCDTKLTELGLDSVDIIQLSSRLTVAGIRLAPSAILKMQTIRRMMGEIKPTNENAHGADLGSLRDIQEQLRQYVVSEYNRLDDVEDVLPATSLQEAMVSGMLKSNFSWYFNHEIFEIGPSVDLEQLRKAWGALFKTLPILRTSFLEVKSASLHQTFCQIVHKNEPLIEGIFDIHGEEEMQTIMKSSTRRAADGNLERDLVQVKFVTLQERRFMMCSLAHALYDGWSLHLLYQHLHNAYEDSLSYVHKVDQFLTRLVTVDNDSFDFWNSYLEGTQPCLVQIRPLVDQQAAFTPRRSELRSSRSVESIMSYCKAQNIALQTLCEAVWAVVLASRTGSLDVVFGMILSGRDFEGAEDLVFPTMNTVAVRCILHGSPSTFLSYIEEMMNNIRQHQTYPLRKAQAAAGCAGIQLFNSLFMLQRSPQSKPMNDFLISIDGSAAIDYPVCIEAEVQGDGLIWRSACLPSAKKLRPNELVEDLEKVLEFMITNHETDVLQFKGDSVSICGLPAVVLTGAKVARREATEHDPSDDNWTETALAVRQVLSTVSGIEEESINISSRLFHLGLDSISAIKISTLLRQQGLFATAQQLIQAETIEEISKSIDASRPREDQDTTAITHTWKMAESEEIKAALSRGEIGDRDIEAVLPASPLQVYMISVWQNRHGSIFFPTFSYGLSMALTKQEVQSAWNRVVAATPILRTCLLATGVRMMPLIQAVLKPDSVHGTPLVQLEVDDRQSQCVVKVKIHHAIYDAFSITSIIDRFESELKMEHVELQTLDLWRSYVCSMATTLRKLQLSKFWMRYLKDIPAAAPHPYTPGARDEQISSFKAKALSSVGFLRKIALKNGLTVQSLFFSAYAKVLAAQSSQSCVVFGVYLANRAAMVDLPSSYPTLNLVPLRVHISDSEDLVAVAGRVQHDLLQIGSEGRADAGLWEIAWWANVKVSSFVNFLSIPDTESEGLLKLLPAGDESPGEPVSSTARQWLDTNTVLGDYPVSRTTPGLDVSNFNKLARNGYRSCNSRRLFRYRSLRPQLPHKPRRSSGVDW